MEVFALTHAARAIFAFFRVSADAVVLELHRDFIGEADHRLVVDRAEARDLWKAFLAAGFVRDLRIEDCENGRCDHYVCTEGRAVAEWERGNAHLHEDPAVVRADYLREALGPTAADAARA